MCHLRPLLSVIIKGVSNLPVLGTRHSLLHKLVIDALMHKGPGSSCTALTLQERSSTLKETLGLTKSPRRSTCYPWTPGVDGGPGVHVWCYVGARRGGGECGLRVMHLNCIAVDVGKR